MNCFAGCLFELVFQYLISLLGSGCRAKRRAGTVPIKPPRCLMVDHRGASLKYRSLCRHIKDIRGYLPPLDWFIPCIILKFWSFILQKSPAQWYHSCASVLLDVLPKVLGITGSRTVAVRSVLFVPCNYVFFIIFMARYERQKMATDLVSAAPQSPWTLPGIVFLVLLII
jgi:hypothetical protein